MAKDAVREAERFARAFSKPSRCATCNGDAETLKVINRMIGLRNDPKPVVLAIETVYDYVVKNLGYKRSLGAIREHVRRCLGVRGRAA